MHSVIRTKLLLIIARNDTEYNKADQYNKELKTIEIKYNDLSLQSINRNTISLVVKKTEYGINKININMTNTIGNVLRFRKDLEPALNIFIKHDHKYSDINHKHTLDYFANAILEKYELINDTAKTLENSDSIINQIKAPSKVC